MFQINVHNNTVKLDDLIQAAKNGEDILIVTDDQVKFIIEVKSAHPRPQYGSAEGLIEITEDFKDYMP